MEQESPMNCGFVQCRYTFKIYLDGIPVLRDERIPAQTFQNVKLYLGGPSIQTAPVIINAVDYYPYSGH